ncbi:MAG: hypothetical protein MHPSP_000991 [Paramarteilia canceri]
MNEFIMSEEKNKVKADNIESAKVRGDKALEKELANTRFTDLVKSLDHLSKQELIKRKYCFSDMTKNKKHYEKLEFIPDIEQQSEFINTEIDSKNKHSSFEFKNDKEIETKYINNSIQVDDSLNGANLSEKSIELENNIDKASIKENSIKKTDSGICVTKSNDKKSDLNQKNDIDTKAARIKELLSLIKIQKKQELNEVINTVSEKETIITPHSNDEFNIFTKNMYHLPTNKVEKDIFNHKSTELMIKIPNNTSNVSKEIKSHQLDRKFEKENNSEMKVRGITYDEDSSISNLASLIETFDKKSSPGSISNHECNSIGLVKITQSDTFIQLENDINLSNSIQSEKNLESCSNNGQINDFDNAHVDQMYNISLESQASNKSYYNSNNCSLKQISLESCSKNSLQKRLSLPTSTSILLDAYRKRQTIEAPWITPSNSSDHSTKSNNSGTSARLEELMRKYNSSKLSFSSDAIDPFSSGVNYENLIDNVGEDLDISQGDSTVSFLQHERNLHRNMD